MKLLKRKILFTLAGEIDFFLKAEGFEYKPYKFLYERLRDYSQSSIRDAILQLVESGEADKIAKNSLSFFRLTGRGRERLLSFFPISVGQKRVWDRIWRIALINSKFKMQNAKLRKLRRGLRKLGFRKFSRGVYLSPLPISKDIKEYLLKNNLFGMATVIESRKLLVGDDVQLAWRIWKLGGQVEGYNQFIKGVDKLLKVLKKQKNLSNKSKSQFSLLLDVYFSLLEGDPGLPKKLLPVDWPANLAREKMLKLVEEIKNQSHRVRQRREQSGLFHRKAEARGRRVHQREFR